MIDKNTFLSHLNVVSRRLAASFIDLAILLVVLTVTTLAVSWAITVMKEPPTDQQLKMIFPSVDADSLRYAWYEAIARGVAPYAMSSLPIVWWLYESIFSIRKLGRTPGKWLFCLKITSTKNRDTRFGEIALRSAIKIMVIMSMLFISSLYTLALATVLLLLIPMFSGRGQFLHDFIPGTNVTAQNSWTTWASRKSVNEI